ncbi:MAG: hypothetical protein ACI87J_001977 [Colwellia sp.]|jgi:hypothetical protein
MLNTNISQIRVVVKTEVVPNFFLEVAVQARAENINIGDNCFIYDDDGFASEAICTGVNDDHTVYEKKDGQTHVVANIEPALNAYEFNRLLSAIFTPSEERSGYDQYVVNRALCANVLEPSATDVYDFTETGKSQSKMHFMGLNTS